MIKAMKSYVIDNPKNMVLQTEEGARPGENFAKVRITKAGISESDIQLYAGGGSYPIVPGRQGAGVVSEIAEDNPAGLKKGDRVFLNPYIPCRNCFHCKTNRPELCPDMSILGVNRDGFLRDFANIPLENLIRLPEQVSDTEAIFTEYISLAHEILDTLGIEKGDHIAIVGGDVLGNILAQLAIFHQAIPVLIDSHEQNLETARQTKIYYTISEEKDVETFLSSITGGRLAKFVVYISGQKKQIRRSLNYCRNGGTVAVAGFNSDKLTANLSVVLERQLKIIGFNKGFSEMRSALNTLATKSILIEPLIKKIIKFKDVPYAFSSQAENGDDAIYQMIVDCII